MAELETVARGLVELDEEELTAQLGALAQAVEMDASAASLEAAVDVPTPRGIFDDLFQAGMAVLNSVSPKAYELFCTPIGGNSELAAELDQLMNQKTAEAAAKMTGLLTPVLVGSLGLPQSIAVLVGSLIVKKLAKGASNFVCDNWKESLPSPVDPPADSSSTSPEPA